MDISHSQDAAPYGLADLLAPLTTQEFLNSIYEKKPIHIQGTAEKFAFAMSWDILNGILNQSSIWTPQSLQLVLDTDTVPPQQYTREGLALNGGTTLQIDFEKVRALVGRGASLVLNSIEGLTPGVKRIAELLGREPGGKVQTNLYCSWQAHQAFDVHFDTHDVFAMQVTGEKNWRIYQRHFQYPINHPAFKMLPVSYHHQHKGPLLMEFTMRPGDLVYIPRGYYHEAMAQSDSTVHLSFSVVKMIGVDVLTVLYEHGVMDDVFRAHLPDPTAREGKALDEHLMRIAGRLRELLREPKIRTQIESAITGFRYPVDRIKLPDDAGKK